MNKLELELMKRGGIIGYCSEFDPIPQFLIDKLGVSLEQLRAKCQKPELTDVRTVLVMVLDNIISETRPDIQKKPTFIAEFLQKDRSMYYSYKRRYNDMRNDADIKRIKSVFESGGFQVEK